MVQPQKGSCPALEVRLRGFLWVWFSGDPGQRSRCPEFRVAWITPKWTLPRAPPPPKHTPTALPARSRATLAKGEKSHRLSLELVVCFGRYGVPSPFGFTRGSHLVSQGVQIPKPPFKPAGGGEQYGGGGGLFFGEGRLFFGQEANMEKSGLVWPP